MLSSFTINAQPIKPKQLLKNTDAALNDIQTVVYRVNYAWNFASKDTIQRTAICSLYMDYNDIMDAHHIMDVKSSKEKEYIHFQYDGINAATITYHTDSLNTAKKRSIKNVAENSNYLIGTTFNRYLLQDFFSKKNTFRQANSFAAKILVKKMEIEETTHLNEPVYLLTIYAKNIKIVPNYVQNAVNKYYIRKSDFLPVAHSFYGEIEGVSEYEYYEIDYLAVNPNIPLKAFKLDTNVTEIKPKTLYENVQKHGL